LLDPQAGRILKDCLDAKVRTGYGFSTVYYLDDERNATLELIWNWAPENAPLRIHTSHIKNATVTDDDGRHTKHLLPVSGEGEWEVFNGHDKLITLERQDLEKDIVINIETKPDVRATHIVIPAVPKKQDCKPSIESKDAFGQAYSKTLTSVDVNKMELDSDDGNGHKYVHWTVDVAESFPDIGKDGIVTGVICRKTGSSLDFYDVYPQGTHAGSKATCSGMFQNAGKFMSMEVSWFKKGYTCTDIKWPAETTSTAK
jgi:hypothetical protein